MVDRDSSGPVCGGRGRAGAAQFRSRQRLVKHVEHMFAVGAVAAGHGTAFAVLAGLAAQGVGKVPGAWLIV